MPKSNQHIKQAKHNISFLENFYNSHQFNDWSITVSFYIAVHIIEAAIFKTKKIEIKSQTLPIEHSEQLLNHRSFLPKNLSYHDAINIIIKYIFPEISAHMKMLQNKSRTARYVNYSFKKLETELLVKQQLKAIISWYNKNYSDNIRLNIN